MQDCNLDEDIHNDGNSSRTRHEQLDSHGAQDDRDVSEEFEGIEDGDRQAEGDRNNEHEHDDLSRRGGNEHGEDERNVTHEDSCH